MLIDAKRKFTTRHMTAFRENHSPDDMVDCMLTNAGCVVSYKLSDIRDFFTDNSVIDIMKDDEVVDLTIGDDILEFTGYDYLWWIAPIRGVQFGRLDRLLNEETTEKTVKTRTKSTYSVACGIKKDDEIINVETFNGAKADVIEFMNKYYSKQLLKSYFEAQVVFIFNYQDEADLTHNSNWKTLDELAAEGKVTLV